ncbi:hypothetical protein [Billgrantia endophytica]|uniref:hypothetical protein n=1 Tax=Billgrantia endophytica TaxID=2033802 RepID=UPI001054C54B|nr:hypothetical protein [Halomonas endophytica]
MKYATIIMQAMTAGALTLSMAAHVTAAQESHAHTRISQTSLSQWVGGTQRYDLEVTQASQLDIRSQGPVVGASHYRLNGVLLDEQRNILGTADQVGAGQISLNQAVQPGRYIFEVSGFVLGGKRDGFNRYRLVVDGGQIVMGPALGQDGPGRSQNSSRWDIEGKGNSNI